MNSTVNKEQTGERPVISIVTAAYNAADFIGRTIDSVLAQSLENFELIIVDDGSTDATAAIAATYLDERIEIIRQPNQGVSAARNVGMGRARAPFLLFLDADDLLEADALAQFAARLTAKPQCIAIVGGHVKINETGELLGPSDPEKLRQAQRVGALPALLAKNIIVNGGAICMRRDAAQRIEPFRADLALGEDWEFWCRLALEGEFDFDPEFRPLRYRVRLQGANARLRTGPWAHKSPAAEVVYANPVLHVRLAPARLRRLRRAFEADAFWDSARLAWTSGRPAVFAQFVMAGALRYPDSLLKPARVALFLRSLAGRG